MPRGVATLLLIVGLLGLWQGLHLLVGPGSLSSPWTTLVHLQAMMTTAAFWANVAETATAFAYALLLAVLGGLALGIVLGVRRFAGEVAEPILLNLYAIPKVTLYPLVLLLFGLGLSAKVAFGVMHGLIPILLFSMNAIRQLPPILLRSARAMRLSPLQTATRVVLPAILPELIAGLRLGFSLTLLGVLIGEMFASQRGLGWLVTRAMGLGDIATLMAVALFLTLVAVSCNALLLALDRRLRHGQPATALT